MIHTSNTITHEWWIPRTIALKEKDSRQQVIEQAVLYLKSSTEEFVDNYNGGITTSLTVISQVDCCFSTDNLTEFTEWSNLTENQVLEWCGVTFSSVSGEAKNLMDKNEFDLLKKIDSLENPRDYTVPTWEKSRFS